MVVLCNSNIQYCKTETKFCNIATGQKLRRRFEEMKPSDAVVTFYENLKLLTNCYIPSFWIDNERNIWQSVEACINSESIQTLESVKNFKVYLTKNQKSFKHLVFWRLPCKWNHSIRTRTIGQNKTLRAIYSKYLSNLTVKLLLIIRILFLFWQPHT